jgi:hypothetical protein
MILLAGGNTALLEGLAQALANTGHRLVVAHSLSEAEELQSREPALLTAVMAGGGALVTYREAGDTSRALPAPLARHVLADLVLPLERNRLVSLSEAVATRAKAVGRKADATHRDAPPS